MVGRVELPWPHWTSGGNIGISWNIPCRSTTDIPPASHPIIPPACPSLNTNFSTTSFPHPSTSKKYFRRKSNSSSLICCMKNVAEYTEIRFRLWWNRGSNELHFDWKCICTWHSKVEQAKFTQQTHLCTHKKISQCERIFRTVFLYYHTCYESK